ncbi:hypothetical protein [Bosea caraganae]|nr:hypothetical protein [Bosea caraganae]
MDLIARLILRLAILFEPPVDRALRPVPVPVRANPPRLPGAPR